MPTRWETFPIECQGGLITNLPPIQQGMKLPGTAGRLVNFEPSVQGGYRRINGYSKWDSTVVPVVTDTNPILGVAFYDGEVIAVREDKIHTSAGSGWTQIATGRTHAGKHRFHRFNFDGSFKIIGVDGTDHPYTWDGTTFTEVTGSTDVTGASHAVSFKDHMFYAKADLVTFSAPFDETDFTVANGAGNFRMPNPVTGIIVFRSSLFVFTAKEIMVLDGDSVSDFRLTSVSERIGCCHEDTIQEVGGDVMFLSDEGVRLLGATDRLGDFSNVMVSKKIQSQLTNFHDLYDSFSTVILREKSQYRLFGYLAGRDAAVTEGFIATQITPDASEDSFAWSSVEGIKAFSLFSDMYDNEEYVIFSNDDGYVYRMESGSTFDGTEITSSYWTPYLSFSDPTYRKTLYKINMYFSPEGDITGVLNVNYDQDNANKVQPGSIPFSASGGGDTWDNFNWDTGVFADAPNADIDKQLVGSGFNASLQFEFEGSDPFVFDTIMIEYSMEGRT